MIRTIILAALVVTAGCLALPSQHNASACNKTAGCVMDSFREDYDMKRDGRRNAAIKAGQDNVEAFRALQAKQKASSAKK